MCPYHRKVWPTPHTPQGEHRRSGARKLSSAQVRASALLSLTLPKGSFTRMSFSSFDAVGFALTEVRGQVFSHSSAGYRSSG